MPPEGWVPTKDCVTSNLETLFNGKIKRPIEQKFFAEVSGGRDLYYSVENAPLPDETVKKFVKRGSHS